MVDDLFDAVVGYCADDVRSEKLRKTFVDPVLVHLTSKFNWVFRAVQAVAALVVVQFVVVLWILFLTCRRRG